MADDRRPTSASRKQTQEPERQESARAAPKDDRTADRRTPPTGERPTTTSALRKEIDEGRAGDKVANPDPAAAPLGTDAEAAGAPVVEQEARMAERDELGRGQHEEDRIGEGTNRQLPLLLGALVIILLLVAIWFTRA